MSHETQIVASSVREAMPLPAPLPAPRVEISVRTGTIADVPFIDFLQKSTTYEGGFMHAKVLEDKLVRGQVLIAEDPEKVPLGYVIASDQYLKRDDLGIIYQLSVTPVRRRSLIGATLVKAVFERAAYGCKLFCCWCAQDLKANHFWEACGFVPLAFRTGCQKRKRIHIFWQRRIHDGDTTTPWWFPSQTRSGAFHGDRLVLPIPPGTHWRDVMPVILPGTEEPKQLPKPRTRQAKTPIMQGNTISAGALRMEVPKAMKEPEKKSPPPKRKNDRKHVAAARELRDRYLEEVNRDGQLLPSGKYDVARQIAATVDPQIPLLAA